MHKRNSPVYFSKHSTSLLFPRESIYDAHRLGEENRKHVNTGGVSQENRHLGFVPAFLDPMNGKVYRSTFADGRPAPIHLLEGLPKNLMAQSDKSSKYMLHDRVISGFTNNGIFYSRDDVAKIIRGSNTEQ